MSYLFWEDFDDDIIRDVAGNSVEFSAKLSNSTAKGGVAVRHYVDLPYLAVSTIAPGKVEPKSVMPANYAKAVKQTMAVKLGTNDQYGVASPSMLDRISILSQAVTGKLGSNRKAKIIDIVQGEFSKIPVPDDEIARIRELIANTEAGSKLSIRLDPRLKQLLVFDPDLNTDLSVTPLRSAGLPELIAVAEHQRAAALGDLTDAEYEQLRFMKGPAADKALKANNSKSDKKSRLYRHLFPRCAFPLGGTNPQNLGLSEASAIRSPLLIQPPSVNQEMSQAFSIHYKGINPVGYGVAAKLLDTLHQEKLNHSFDLRFKEKMTAQARSLISDMNYRAQLALEQLRARSIDIVGTEECEDEDLLDADLLGDLIQSGILIRKKRDNEWRKAYADLVINYLMSIKFKPRNESALVKSAFSDKEAAIIRTTIEKETI
jgi:hypothetical protein